jgi:hypothetical protein
MVGQIGISGFFSFGETQEDAKKAIYAKLLKNAQMQGPRDREE